MERRTFLGTLAGGFLTAPLAAQAQTPARVPRIGVLAIVPRSAPGIRAFDDRLQDLGYVDGRTIAVEFRASAEYLERLPGLAAELVRLDIALLVAAGAEPAARAARQAAGSSLPIIMVAIDYDPIALGYVTSLARPAGNITGVVGQQIELTRKRVELLKEALPRASRVAILWEAASGDQFKAAQATARSLSLNVQSLELHSPSYELSDAFRRAVAGRPMRFSSPPRRSCSRTARRSPGLPERTDCPRCPRCARSRTPAGSWPTERVLPECTLKLQSTWTRSSRAPSPAICPSSSPRSSSWSSTSRPPRPSA